MHYIVTVMATMITAFGKTQTQAAWSRELGICQATLSRRVKRGIHGNEALAKRCQSASKGKTWGQIYQDSNFIKKKRASLIKLGKRTRTDDEKKKLSATLKFQFLAGRKPSFLGRKLTTEHKRKIGKTRRERYGTLSSVNKQIRFTARYKKWRTEVFVRDAYTCQQCGINTYKKRARVYLHAHHKIELWQLIKGKTFEQAMKMRRVWDKDNAVTLCRECHAKHPVSYHVRNNKK